MAPARGSQLPDHPESAVNGLAYVENPARALQSGALRLAALRSVNRVGLRLGKGAVR